MFYKDKEEFSRKDPEQAKGFYWLAAFSWIIPAIIVVIGAFMTTQRFAPTMNYDPTVIGNPLFVLPNGYRIYNPLIFIMGIFRYAFNSYYSKAFFYAAPPVAISLVLAALIFLITSTIVSAHQKNQHIHGTARFATEKDLRRYGHLQQRGVVCAQLAKARTTYKINVEKASLTLHCKKPAKLVCHSGSTNTFIIAPTRAGKGVNSIIPTCINYGVPYWEYDKKQKRNVIKGRGSMIIFDPKGENWAATAGWRSQFSVCMPFRPLDPNGETVHYNPMAEIPEDASQAFATADSIGEIFFGAGNAKEASGDGASEYFKNTARDIFVGVVLHVRFSEKIKWEDKNLSTVLKVFSEAAAEDDGGEEGAGPGGAMLDAMENDSHGSDKIHELIVKAAGRSRIQTPKERASTYSTVFSKIALFQDPLIANATKYSDFSIEDFIKGKNGISLYLIVPYSDITRIAPVFRMLITFMIKKFSQGETNANEVKLKIPCLFLLDEFPVLGYFPDIAKNMGILAGYGVTFMIVAQALNQIIDVYGENHPFLDHCKTIILYAPGNVKDARAFSEMIGNRSVLLDNISSSGTRYKAGWENVSRSSQETSTSLISPDELMKLEFNRVLVFIQNAPPYKGKKVVYYEDARFKPKAFLPIPEYKMLMNFIKKLPTARIQRQKILEYKNKYKPILDPLEVAKAFENMDFNKVFEAIGL